MTHSVFHGNDALLQGPGPILLQRLLPAVVVYLQYIDIYGSVDVLQASHVLVLQNTYSRLFINMLVQTLWCSKAEATAKQRQTQTFGLTYVTHIPRFYTVFVFNKIPWKRYKVVLPQISIGAASQSWDDNRRASFHGSNDAAHKHRTRD